MAKFSPTDAVFAGFRFAKERPATILVWAAYLLVVGTVAIVAMFDIGGDTMTSLLLAVQADHPDMAQISKLMQQVAPASLFAELLVTIFGAVLAAAILRVRLTPGPHPWGGLRLGGDELRLLGGTVLVMLCVFSLSLSAAFIADLAATVGGAAVAPFVLGPGLALVLALQVRLSLVAVICQAEGRISLPRSLLLTRGIFWRLVGAYVLLGAITLVILFLLTIVFTALVEAAALATGGGLNQMILALQGRFASINPVVAAITVISNLAQVWVMVVFLAVFLSVAVDAYKTALIDNGERA
jgi:hypothetical protein